MEKDAKDSQELLAKLTLRQRRMLEGAIAFKLFFESIDTKRKLAPLYKDTDRILRAGNSLLERIKQGKKPFLISYELAVLAWWLKYPLRFPIWIKRSSYNIFLHEAPGTHLLLIVEFICSPTTVELTFEPIIAEWQHEYFEALKAGRLWKARWVSLRSTYNFAKALGLSRFYAILKGLGIITGIMTIIRKLIT